MNTKYKNILSIVFSIFMGNGLILILSAIFHDQLLAVLPDNANFRSFVVELISALISIGLIFLFKRDRGLESFRIYGLHFGIFIRFDEQAKEYRTLV